ncbi:aldo/keto reductase [Thermaurantiacus sp.]
MEPLAVPADPRPLGRSGLACRPLGWSFRPGPTTTAETVLAALGAARRAGAGLIVFSDHPPPASRLPAGRATMLLGEAFRGRPEAKDGILLALAGGLGADGAPCSSREQLVTEVDAACERLGLASLDLFLLLRPDFLTPAAATAAALDALVASGRVKAVGVANHRPGQVRALLARLQAPLALLGTPFSVLDPAAASSTADLAQELGVPVLATAPLAEGRIGDRPGSEERVTARAVLRALDTIADREGTSRAAVAGAFLACHACRAIPLFGTQDPDEIEALRAMFRVRLARADWYRLLEAGLGHLLPTTEADR